VIFKLDRQDHRKVRSLLPATEQIYNRTVHAIIDGVNRGTIYVDDLSQPKTALVDVTGISSLFIGDPHNQKFTAPLREFIDTKLKIDTYESCGGTYFIAVLSDEAWEKAIEEAISHRDYEPDFECYFTFHPDRFLVAKSSFKPLPSGYSARKIDAAVIERDRDEYLSNAIAEFWYSVDDFLKQGLGYCIMKGDEVVSACFSCCVYGKHHEINVETYREEERSQGLATAACVLYLEHCLQFGLTPHWATMETNEASIRLGEKLGFQYDSRLKTLEFEF
jgi:GNAT superfamily N-acetyltransferase